MVPTDVPATLESLVTEFLPRAFSAAKAKRGVGTYHGHCVVGDGERAWTLAVQDGELRIEAGSRNDAIGQLTLTSSDLPVLLAELYAALIKNHSLGAAEPFSLSERSATEIRELPGSVAIEIRSEAGAHELRATFGDIAPSLASVATCRVTLSMQHLVSIVSGEQHPLQLLFRGDLQITGDTSLPTLLGMALLAPE
jgi:SCP-2 sterol transfer family